ESLGKASMTWRIYSRTANLFSSRPPPWRLFHSSRSAAKYQFFEVPFIKMARARNAFKHVFRSMPRQPSYPCHPFRA
ncbi:MAG: hypothetical protein ACK41W_04840, partial [Cyanobacteriota bacterium]